MGREALMREGVDFSYGRPGGAALEAAGKDFVIRYVRPGDGRTLTAAEVVDYRSHGLAICLVFESSAKRALSGRAAGRTDAAAASSRASALGFPDGIPVYFAVDFDAQAGQYPAIDDYLHGAAESIGLARVGVYGHRDLMAHCAQARSASWFWQTRAWSAGKVYAGNHLYQYETGSTGAAPIAGAAVDLDRAMKADYGQWAPPQETAVQTAKLTYHEMANAKTTRQVVDRRGAVIHHTPATPTAYPLLAVDLTDYEIRLPGNVAGFIRKVDVGSISPIPDPAPAPAPDCSAVEHELATANARIHTAITALGGTPT